MLPVLRSRMANSGRDVAHRDNAHRSDAHRDDAVERSKRRAFLTPHAAVVAADNSRADASLPSNDPSRSSFQATRARAFPAPRSLSTHDDRVAAASILVSRAAVDDNSVADRNVSPKLREPNRDAFLWRGPRRTTRAIQCMRDGAYPKRVRIQSTAECRDVTPRTAGALDRYVIQVDRFGLGEEKRWY